MPRFVAMAADYTYLTGCPKANRTLGKQVTSRQAIHAKALKYPSDTRASKVCAPLASLSVSVRMLSMGMQLSAQRQQFIQRANGCLTLNQQEWLHFAAATYRNVRENKLNRRSQCRSAAAML